MRRVSGLSLWATLGCVWLGCESTSDPELELLVQGVNEPFAQEGDSNVVVEAEHFHRTVERQGIEWHIESASGASGEEIVRPLPESGSRITSGFETQSPQLDFDVHFESIGDYYLWIRMQDPGASADTCHAGLDESASSTSAGIDIDVQGQWVWTNRNNDNERVVVSVDSTGLHTVNLWMRETAVMVDKIVLTTDPSFDPSGVNGGLGPDESARVAPAPVDAGSPDAGPQDSGASPEPGYQQAAGLVVFEAEGFDGSTAGDGHEWGPVAVSGSVGGAMSPTPDDGTRYSTDFESRSPRLDFEVNMVETGTHYLWIRMQDPGGSRDTCHAGLDGSPNASTTGVDIDDEGAWVWTNQNNDNDRMTVDVSSVGVHTVNLWMRETGVLIDRLLLTSDPGYDPSTVSGGQGPPVSARGGSSGGGGSSDAGSSDGGSTDGGSTDAGGGGGSSCGDGTCDANEHCSTCASDCGTCPPPPTTDLRAFPGAEGFGSDTPGGRGGRVIFVTNTNDSGSGSLRSALAASGPRIIVFRTGGTIELQSGIRIDNPYVTVAGQTAPGGGIAIRNGSNTDTVFKLYTHDVIFRGLRIRPGPGGSPDGIYMNGNAYNVVIDHCSVSWAVDENVTAADGAHDITIQWSIISQGLLEATHTKGKHSMGLMLGNGEDDDSTHNISVHHNLLAHNFRRNPLCQIDGTLDFVNNTVYNWGDDSWSGHAGAFLQSSDVNYIGNYIQHGPSSNDEYPIDVYSSSPVEVFVQGNYSSLYRMSLSQPQANVVEPEDHYALVSSPFSAPPVQTLGVFDAHMSVLQNAGARLPSRDSVDADVVQSVLDGTAMIIDDPSEMGGWPQLASGSAPADQDNDGMPDSFEVANGLNPNDASDANATNLSVAFTGATGYTNIEVYINSLWG